MARRAPVIVVSERQQRILDKLDRGGKTPQQIVPRVRIVKLSAEGLPNKDQAAQLGVGHEAVGRWRQRWLDGQDELAAAEDDDVSDLELERLILKILGDAPRSGAPPRFAAHQLAQLFSLACKSPEECGVPLSHWTPSALAHEMQKQGHVDSISPRQVDRFLKGGGSPTTQGRVLAAKHAQRSRPVRPRGARHLQPLRAGDDPARAGRARGEL
jgi:putative transposase